MLEFTYGDIRNVNYVSGMRAIVTAKSTDIDRNVTIIRLTDKLEVAQRESQKVFDKLVESYGTIKKDGTIDIPDEKIKEWETAHADFMATPVKVKGQKLRRDHIDGVPLTPVQIKALGFVVDGLIGMDT